MTNLIGFCINLLMAILVYFDSNKFKRCGVKITPILWSLFVFLGSILALLVYIVMRYVAWKVQLKAIQEPNTQKRSSTVKIITRLSIILIVFIFFSAVAGCHKPFVANFVHKKIKIGMTVKEVVDILEKYKGFHHYTILLLNEEATKECNKIKPEYEKCIRSGVAYDCHAKFKSYGDNCEGKLIHKADEFMRIMDDVVKRKVNYATYEAEAIALFMGPALLHNSFEVHFNYEDKVESITPVRHWD